MACEEFVARVLESRDRAHLAHWATKSYAEHKALNDFYDGVLGLIDGFVEQYQGAYGKRLQIALMAATAGDIKKHLAEQAEWIEDHRYEVCVKADTALQNTIDEVLRQYQTTLYLLSLQ